MGAQSVYTDELADNICEMLATTSIGLKHICEKYNVSHSTVRSWIADKDHPMSDKYTRAKQLQIEYMAEETLDIADDGSNDLMTIVKGEESYEVENKEVTNRSRLRVDTRKWLLSKLNPKKYGDKIQHSGDAENPISIITGMRVE